MLLSIVNMPADILPLYVEERERERNDEGGREIEKASKEGNSGRGI